MHSDCQQFSGDTGRVLLVDDERVLRRVLQRALSRAGFEVVEASDGRAALDLLDREHFDLIVSDVQMPNMNGLELLEALSTAHAGVPVVLISGSLEVPEKDSALRLGAFDFLKKPFPIADLQESALRAANSRRDASSRPPAAEHASP